MRVFLTSTSANKHVLFALGSNHTGRDNVEISQVGVSLSLVPRPLPDFISQLWRKNGRRPGTITRHGPEMVDSVST